MCVTFGVRYPAQSNLDQILWEERAGDEAIDR